MDRFLVKSKQDGHIGGGGVGLAPIDQSRDCSDD